MSRPPVSPPFALLLLLLLLLAVPVPAGAPDSYIVLSWNDLGMHCMNRDHDELSILPPYNNLLAQVIDRGDATTPARLVTTGVTLEYSIPGNTYSAGKTNFWDYAFHLFGVNLPPDVGLTGLGLTGTFTLHGTHFAAEGIPVTPFPDATPNVEDPYQQALVVLRDSTGAELHHSRPVIPVSTEVNCTTTGCHSSVHEILTEHPGPDEGGFSLADQPILCAWCHGSTPLTGPDPGVADWFSFRIHEKHKFLDQQLPGLDGCQMCHPGPVTRCLRGTMATNFGLICQDCHGNLEQVSQSIEQGRIPWLDEPACRTCHTAQFGEPVGVLYREATGHGGLLCSACHNSPHAIWPSREPRDNDNAIALQGHAGILSECGTCHAQPVTTGGPHGLASTAAVEAELLEGSGRLEIFPSPLRAGTQATILARDVDGPGTGTIVYDARGRALKWLESSADRRGGTRAVWDGTGRDGERVPAGVYFVRTRDRSGRTAAGKVVVLP